MTDKQEVIIDGVDVSGCKGFNKDGYKRTLFDCHGKELLGYCLCDPNCYYKQLQRKIAEYEELKDEICNLSLGINGDIKPKVFGRSLKEILEALLLNKRYKQALDEIKGICSQDRTISDVRLICSQSEKHRVKYDIQDKILDIISRAKGDSIENT